MSQSSNQRLIVLQLVREKREILFGPFSPKLTKKMKEECWEKIRIDSVSAGAVGLAGKNWQCVRDSVWQACRRDAMSRKDKERKSGEGTVQFTEADQIVFEIVGRDSPAIIGLDVGDAEDAKKPNALSNKGENIDEEIVEITAKAESSGSVFRTPRPASRLSKKSFDSEDDLDHEIKRTKLHLLKAQLEGQKLLNEQHRLSIEKLKIEVLNYLIKYLILVFSVSSGSSAASSRPGSTSRPASSSGHYHCGFENEEDEELSRF